MLREKPAAERLRQLRATEPLPLICAISVEEVWRGARRHETDAIHRLVGALRTVPLTAREGELAGNWRREYANRGVTLSQSDCLIAAAADEADARLATGNPDHFPMRDLVVEHWPAGA